MRKLIICWGLLWIVAIIAVAIITTSIKATLITLAIWLFVDAIISTILYKNKKHIDINKKS